MRRRNRKEDRYDASTEDLAAWLWGTLFKLQAPEIAEVHMGAAGDSHVGIVLADGSRFLINVEKWLT